LVAIANGDVLNEPPKVIIRTAQPQDEAALGRLGALLVSVHHAFDADRFIAPGAGTQRSYGRFLASQLDQPDAIVLVAEDGDRMLGYAYAGLEGRDWMALRGAAGVIYDIIVEPDRRREGIARILLRAMFEALASRGAPRVVLFTATHNEAAQRLFAAAGFRSTMIEMTREWPET
jgi:ribosomal protein S18 acetylase RimI-like enzyme